MGGKAKQAHNRQTATNKPQTLNCADPSSFSAETLDTQPLYTEEELRRFEAELRDKEEELRRKAVNLRQEQELLKERGKALEAQRREYQQVTLLNPKSPDGSSS